MIMLGCTHKGALLACFFTLLGNYGCNCMVIVYNMFIWHFLDNSLQIQSRVIMLDSFVIFFTYLSILGYLKVYHYRSQ